MSLSLAKGICALCCVRTSNITMSVELTCPWTKMRRFLGQWPPMVALPSVPFSADYITNIAGFEFPTETGSRLPRAVPRSRSRGVAAPQGNAHRRALEAGAQHHRPGGALSLPEHRFPPPWSPHGVARFSAGNKLPVP